MLVVGGPLNSISRVKNKEGKKTGKSREPAGSHSVYPTAEKLKAAVALVPIAQSTLGPNASLFRLHLTMGAFTAGVSDSFYLVGHMTLSQVQVGQTSKSQTIYKKYPSKL